jgi:hypothetical protein
MLANGVLRMLVLVYAPVMVGAIAWAVAACVLVFRRRRCHAWPWRYAHYLTLGLMLPAFVADVGRMDPDAAFMAWIAWLYPVAFILSAVANIRWFLLGRGRWWQTSIPALNTLLAVTYLTRYAAYLGLPVGVLFAGLHVSYAMAQSACTTFMYVFVPIFNWLPTLLVPVDRSRRAIRYVNVIPAVACVNGGGRIPIVAV